jgi:hypothetical protein
VTRLLVTLLVFKLVSKIHCYNSITMRVVPIFYMVVAYYSHTRLIFGNQFDVDGDPYRLMMRKDDLFKLIIQYSALTMNIIYISVFLVIRRSDCVLFNLISWGMFLKDMFTQEGNFILLISSLGTTIESRLSAIFLAVFIFKFALDAHQIKTEI